MDTIRRYSMFIGGDWVDAEDRFEIRSPATEEVVASVARGGLEHADRDGTLFGCLMNQGQACESGTRIIVAADVHDEFVERLIERAKTITIGSPLDPATDFGPVISAEARDRILGYIERGFWVEPTIFTDVGNDMTIAREEIFGPVLAVIRAESADQAIQLANDTEYGLSAGVWTRDNQRALDVAAQLEAGTVWVNDWHIVSSAYPFGGYKQSGLGRELGPHALDEYTEEKFVHLDLSGRLDRRAYQLLLSTPPD
jgi:aldehyde dehydrogenase (NAD+)